MDSLQFYVEQVIHDCFAKNAQNRNIRSVYFEPENSDWKGGFNSSAVFGRIVYEDQQGKKRNGDSIVVKLMPSLDSNQRSKFADVAFFNEIYTYSRIIPFFATRNQDIWNIFPKFYCGSETIVRGPQRANETTLIVLENLSAGGYRMTKAQTFLSIEELRLIIKKLAHFHANSYYFKGKSPKEFYSLVSNLTETHYVVTGEKIGYLNIASDYHIDILSKDEKYREKAEVIRGLLEDADKFLRLVYTTAKEPMAVLCHGDFLRNNLMIKYNSDGYPENVKFFDLPCCRYCSPIVDLALILYMNADQKTRNMHWDELIDIYSASLHEPFPDNDVPSREQVVEEFKINSLNAFLIVAFFLPQMMRYEEIPNFHQIRRDCFLPDFKEFLDTSWYEIPIYVLQKIFERTTKPHYEQVVLEVLKDIINRGYV